MRRIAGEIDSGEWGSGVYSVLSLATQESPTTEGVSHCVSSSHMKTENRIITLRAGHSLSYHPSDTRALSTGLRDVQSLT